MSSAFYWNTGLLLQQKPACLRPHCGDLWKLLLGTIVSFYTYSLIHYAVSTQHVSIPSSSDRESSDKESAQAEIGIVPNCIKELGSFRADLNQSARETSIDPRLLLAIMQVESLCNSEAISEKGAVGLMQVLPSTAEAVGVQDLSRPSQNIRAGAKYLQLLQSEVGTDLDRVLAAYHAGPSSVRKYSGVPPYKITRTYVAKVRSVYSGLLKNHFPVT